MHLHIVVHLCLLIDRSSCSCRNGGCGAIMSGLFRLERGQRLRVLCGSMSSMGPQGNSGGGGGSYVVAEDEDDPLVVAGGGGGTRCVDDMIIRGPL